ncbi:MAG: hypothetical protein ACI8S6_001757 [Myxococcota bacterium]|jgi:hypothetical protein
MGWADLLSTSDERTLPWLGGRDVHGVGRRWTVSGRLPPEVGWHRFEMSGGKRTKWLGPGEPELDYEADRPTVRGYLVGDRLIPDSVTVKVDVHAVFEQTESVLMVEPGLERFSRALTARSGDGKLVFIRQEFPEGSELEVLEAWQDRRDDVDDIPGVTPALQLAFLWLTWQRLLRDERQELVRLAAEAEVAELARLLEQQRLVKDRRAAVRDGAVRRELIHRDFDGAARAALGVSGAELLDSHDDYNGNKVVKFRFKLRRFECVVHAKTLRIIDAGICLIDHASGERGDDRFTLESLPAVIDEAMRTGVLVVFRHV